LTSSYICGMFCSDRNNRCDGLFGRNEGNHEWSEREGRRRAECGGAEVYSALGRDGDAVGNQPHGGAGARAVVSFAAASAGGGGCVDGGGGAFEREHKSARVAGMGNRAHGACAGGSKGAF